MFAQEERTQLHRRRRETDELMRTQLRMLWNILQNKFFCFCTIVISICLSQNEEDSLSIPGKSASCQTGWKEQIKCYLHWCVFVGLTLMEKLLKKRQKQMHVCTKPCAHQTLPHQQWLYQYPFNLKCLLWTVGPAQPPVPTNVNIQMFSPLFSSECQTPKPRTSLPVKTGKSDTHQQQNMTKHHFTACQHYLPHNLTHSAVKNRIKCLVTLMLHTVGVF